MWEVVVYRDILIKIINVLLIYVCNFLRILVNLIFFYDNFDLYMKLKDRVIFLLFRCLDLVILDWFMIIKWNLVCFFYFWYSVREFVIFRYIDMCVLILFFLGYMVIYLEKKIK